MHFEYLLEAGPHQVLRKEVSDQVEEGVQAADLLVLCGCGCRAAPQFGVAWVDSQNQNDSQDGGNYSGGHVVRHGSTTHPSAGASVKSSKT